MSASSWEVSLAFSFSSASRSDTSVLRTSILSLSSDMVYVYNVDSFFLKRVSSIRNCRTYKKLKRHVLYRVHSKVNPTVQKSHSIAQEFST